MMEDRALLAVVAIIAVLTVVAVGVSSPLWLLFGIGANVAIFGGLFLLARWGYWRLRPRRG